MPQESYRSIIEQVARTKSSSLEVFITFCRMGACALSAGTREEEYLEVIKPYSKDELNLLSKAFALFVLEAEKHPYSDILGTYYTEIASHSAKQARGEFYTPDFICELMARLSLNPAELIEKGVPIAINEPACGAGGMVLAAAKQFSPDSLGGAESYVDLLRFTCQDINPVGSDMCFINTSIWGIPAQIILGNTLSQDAPQKIWKNVHWQRVGEDERIKTLALFRMFRSMREVQTKPEAERTPIVPPSADPDANQVEFDFNFGTSRNERAH